MKSKYFCKKCNIELEPEEYIYMGYCEECYKEELKDVKECEEIDIEDDDFTENYVLSNYDYIEF